MKLKIQKYYGSMLPLLTESCTLSVLTYLLFSTLFILCLKIKKEDWDHYYVYFKKSVYS